MNHLIPKKHSTKVFIVDDDMKMGLQFNSTTEKLKIKQSISSSDAPTQWSPNGR